jgi:hypothetical protein
VDVEWDAQVPDRGPERKKRLAPREPMQGGSDCAGLGDDLAAGAVFAVDAAIATGSRC